MKRWPGGFPRLPTVRCPHCGKKLNAAGRLGEDAPPMPTPGDMMVCFGCGEIAAFDARLRLRRMTAVEIAGLDPEETADLRRTQTTIRDFLARMAP